MEYAGVDMRMTAVIPTHNRPKELMALIGQLRYQGLDTMDIMVIDNSDPEHFVDPGTVYWLDEARDPHIYQMWNVGLNWFHNDERRMLRRDPNYCVAVLNDDVILPNNFVERMSKIMALHQPTIAFPNQCRFTSDIWNKDPGPTSLDMRMTGYCFVVNGQHGIRLDERFRWWYGDDDLDWRARSDYNGTYLVSDVTIQHLHPSESTNSSYLLTRVAGEDRERFIAKHGRAPW